MLTPPSSSSSSTSSSPPPTLLKGHHHHTFLHQTPAYYDAPPTFLSSSGSPGGPPTPPPSSGYRHLSRPMDRPPLYYDDKPQQQQHYGGYRELSEQPSWYELQQLHQLQHQQQQHQLLQHLQPLQQPYASAGSSPRRRPATTIDRSTRAPLAPLNWEVPPTAAAAAAAGNHLRGRPREIKRGAGAGGSVAARAGSQAPDLNRSSLATDEGRKEKERGGFRRSARRSLSRSRLIQAVLAVPKKANEAGMKWWRDDEKKSVEDYLPSPSIYQSQQSLNHHKSSTHLYPGAAAAAAAAASPAPSPHYSVIRPATVRSSRAAASRTMRVVVVGAKRVGKTAILRQVACIEDVTKKPYTPTIEDTYQVLLEDGDKPREILIFHDSAGLPDHGSNELKRAYLNVADAFVLVYSVTDHESFNRVDQLKKTIDKHYAKEKKEMPIVVLGNMTDLPGRKVDSEFALNWSQREKVKLFEVTATERNSLIDFVHYIGQRHFHPQSELILYSRK